MSNIFSYIEEQEAGFKNQIVLEDGWEWNFPKHVRRSYLYKNSQFEENNDDRDTRPFKNIVRPILNIQYRTEGFDVKDIEIYVDDPETYYKSFLIKKYHDKWALENEIDTFIDEVVESYVDYGGVLVKNVRGIRPEVVDLRTLAFCDQTDLLSGPFAIKHYFSSSQLKKMEKQGWGDINNGATISVQDLILRGEAFKRQKKDQAQSKTPGKYTEVYELHNCSAFDYDAASEDTERMMYIVAFYPDPQGQKQGVILYRSREPKLPFKFLKRDPIQGRALGFGAVEELFEAQAWTNFSEIQIAEMLEHAAKVLYKSTDPKFKNQNLRDKKTGSVLDVQPNSDVGQLDNQPRNIVVFNDAVARWNEHANTIGAASDLFLGQQPNAGTPFKSVETQLIEGKSLHVWRQGKIAVFIDEVYRDWVIPHLAKEVVKGAKFLSELSPEELMMIAERVSIAEANGRMKRALIDGKMPDRGEYEQVKQMMTVEFARAGNKRFIEILKDEMSGENLSVRTNIAGKQKNLAMLTDKLVNVLRQYIATPELRQDPEMLRLLNTILESSGLSPIMFAPRLSPIQPQAGGSTQGLADLGESAKEKQTA